jgi:hypothetical protein
MNFEDFDFHDSSFLDENDLGRLKKNLDNQSNELDELLLEVRQLKREPSHRYYHYLNYYENNILFHILNAFIDIY